MEDLQRQINNLNIRLDQLNRSSTIPREVETAFTERLANRLFVSQFFKFGQATLVAGSITVMDNRIRVDSIAIISLTTTTGTVVELKAVCTANTLTITSNSGTDTRTVNYLLLL